MSASTHVTRALKNRQLILDCIVKNGVATYGDLSMLTKLSDRCIRAHIDTLRDDEKVCIVRHPYRDAEGRLQPSVFVRPGFKPDFGQPPDRHRARKRAKDFHGVRILNADGSERVASRPVKRPGEATNTRVFHAMPGSVAQIMAATKLSKASVNKSCLYLVDDERAHIGDHEFIQSNGHYQAVYFAGPGVSVPNPIKRAEKVAIAPVFDCVRRDPHALPADFFAVRDTVDLAAIIAGVAP